MDIRQDDNLTIMSVSQLEERAEKINKLIAKRESCEEWREAMLLDRELSRTNNLLSIKRSKQSDRKHGNYVDCP